MTWDQWNQVLSANLDSMFHMTRLVINPMLEKGWGRIVNISSINAQKGQFGQANYSATKAGIHGFTKALAQEVAAKGVTVIPYLLARLWRRWWPRLHQKY